ncbi:ROK family transcriptional regulator [Mesoaciditoga lauensis]|uniref:ROK family transcriptional regulator n=1 Tax=Mesoaciditoga lauensis TaxID=1495039 RepID=UPI0005677BC6|nr:ROK family transcriptional regulator [Mesoaciditoga lauensis]
MVNVDSIRLNNSLKVLNFIMKNEISRADLARKTSLTKTTVGGIVRDFIDLGFLREKRFASSGIGRPSVLLEIIPNSVHAIGLEIERHRVSGCLTDVPGHLLAQKSISFSKSDFSSIMNSIFEVLDDLFAKASKRSVNVNAIVVGAPSPLDRESGIIKDPPKFSDFENVPIVDLMYKKYGVDVWIENDVDMVALGEKWFGEARTLDDFMYVQVNEGIGAGIITNGELYRGKEGYSGEIGHFLIFKNGEYRYLEDLYGVDVIVSRAKKEISPHISSIQDIEKLLASKNKKAEKLVIETGQAIGAAILSMIHTLGISDVFVGGKIVVLGKIFLASVQEMISKHIFSKSEINIRFSNVKETAVAIGAAGQGIRLYLQKLIAEKG